MVLRFTKAQVDDREAQVLREANNIVEQINAGVQMKCFIVHFGDRLGTYPPEKVKMVYPSEFDLRGQFKIYYPKAEIFDIWEVVPDAVRPEEPAPQSSEVDHPAHYNAGGVECIDAIQAALTAEEFRGFCKGNALKYVWRERHKAGDQDLEKGGWYLGRLA